MNEIKPLTSIRGLFAIYVAIYHIFPRTNSFIANGYLSVDLFFVLSGFIMSYVYMAKFTSDIKLGSYLLYLKGRVARVYPLYAFLIVIISIVYFKNNISLPSIGDYSVLFLFLQSFVKVQNNLISHAWSIAVEFIAYLAFPFSILLVSKIRRIIYFILVIALSFTGLYFASLKGYWGPLDIVSGGFSIVRCLSDYTLGIVSFFAFKNFKAKINGVGLEVALLISIGLVLSLLSFRGYDIFVVALFALIIPLLSASRGVVYKFMSLSPLVYLGEISYSIYLIHYPLCRQLVFIPAWVSKKLAFIDVNFTALTMTLLLSIITYHFIEVPCRNFIRGSLKSRSIMAS